MEDPDAEVVVVDQSAGDHHTAVNNSQFILLSEIISEVFINFFLMN